MISQLVFGALLAMSVTFASAAEAGGSPKDVVNKLNVSLIEVMKNAKTLGYQGRFKKLDPVVRETHEFQAIAQLAVGSHWKNLTVEQRQRFVDKLTEYSIATYAAQFDGYAGESFKYESERPSKASRVIVRYLLESPSSKPVKFDYELSEAGGQWAIINIVVDGFSDLASKRAQFTSVIDREGFESLLNKLSEKISDYAANRAHQDT